MRSPLRVAKGNARRSGEGSNATQERDPARVTERVPCNRRALRAPAGGYDGCEEEAARKAAAKSSGELIISKSRVKAAARKCNVASDFYAALDKAVRNQIAAAEARALANKRKTLRPQDL